MSDDFESSHIPVFTCLFSFCLGTVAWVYIFLMSNQPDTDSSAQKFAFGFPLLVLAALALLTALLGVGFLPYAYFSKTRGPMRPILPKCGFYLLPSLALGRAALAVLF